MAEENKVKKRENAAKRGTRLFKEIKSELKKVSWPDRKQLTNNTATVIVATLIVGVIIWTVDFGLQEITSRVFIR